MNHHGWSWAVTSSLSGRNRCTRNPRPLGATTAQRRTKMQPRHPTWSPRSSFQPRHHLIVLITRPIVPPGTIRMQLEDEAHRPSSARGRAARCTSDLRRCVHTAAGTARSMVRRFSLEAAHHETRSLITASGELDLASSPKLVIACREALRGGALTLVVNLSDVTFMDSSGLAGLINVHRSARRAGAQLTVVCPGGPVRELFAVSGTESLFGLQPATLAA